jgi:hypothetical protein
MNRTDNNFSGATSNRCAASTQPTGEIYRSASAHLGHNPNVGSPGEPGAHFAGRLSSVNGRFA